MNGRALRKYRCKIEGGAWLGRPRARHYAVRTDSEMEMTMLDSCPDTAPTQEGQPAGDFFRWKSRDLEKLEALQRLQLEERKYLESIERNGATGRAVEFLWSIVESREIEIRTLQGMAQTG
jgi:hypothetical protein